MGLNSSSVETPSFLMQNFQEFYREVLIQKELAFRTLEEVPEVTPPPPLPDQAPAQKSFSETDEPLPAEPVHPDIKAETLTDSIQHTFRLMFERFSLQAQTQVGEFAVSHFQDALYAMVALLDETFLAFSWVGKQRWERNLMERQFFHTQIAGELVFRKIDDLLSANDPIRNDVATIYMMVLALGFRGKYRGEESEEQLTLSRHDLYKMINRHPPLLFQGGRDQLIPECYEPILSMPAGKGIPDVRSWLTTFAIILVVFIGVSSFLWFKLVKDMDDALGQILTQAQKLGLS
jgi:type VI secretion system protein ImpK